jgi:hypothetical protein
MTDLDPATIMAEHAESPLGWCGGCEASFTDWPCLPYRLAAALAEAQEREQRVRALPTVRVMSSTTKVESMVRLRDIEHALDGPQGAGS